MQRLGKPTIPGEIIRAHYLEPLQMDVDDLARHLGMDIKELSGVVDGAFPVTMDIAMRLVIPGAGFSWNDSRNQYKPEPTRKVLYIIA